MVIQSKNWNGQLSGQVVRDLQGALSNQYPDRIGIIVINDGGEDIRAKNLAKNTTNTILIYNFRQLKNLKRDLRRLSKQNRLRTQYQSLETLEQVEIIEQKGKLRRKIIGKNYTRYSSY